MKDLEGRGNLSMLFVRRTDMYLRYFVYRFSVQNPSSLSNHDWKVSISTRKINKKEKVIAVVPLRF